MKTKKKKHTVAIWEQLVTDVLLGTGNCTREGGDKGQSLVDTNI